MKLDSLEDLMVEQMRDLYDAEKKLVKALPKMAKAACSDDLRNAFENHLEETQGHVQRLERVFTLMGLKAKAKTCAAMEGLIEEGKEMIGEQGDGMVKDAGLIACAQRVEHYEMAGYGCLHTWAQQLGHHEAAGLLAQTLSEEKAADTKLTHIAESAVNEEAAHASSEA
jgi:ferritin-like metal-binding protein YciE